MEPEQAGKWLAFIILIAALASFAVMFVNRAEPPARDTGVVR